MYHSIVCNAVFVVYLPPMSTLTKQIAGQPPRPDIIPPSYTHQSLPTCVPHTKQTHFMCNIFMAIIMMYVASQRTHDDDDDDEATTTTTAQKKKYETINRKKKQVLQANSFFSFLQLKTCFSLKPF